MVALDRDQRKTYRAQLRTSHRIHIRAGVYDHNEDFRHWITAPLLDGQLDVDLDSTPDATASLIVGDPDMKVRFGHVFADNFVCIEYGIDVPDLEKRVWHPVIFGTVTGLSHAEGETTIELASKDTLLTPPIAWGRYVHSAGAGTGGNAIANWTPQEGNSNHNETQQLRRIGPIKGGSYRLRFHSHTTDPIAFDATAAEIEAALESLPAIDPGDVNVTGGPLTSKPVNITFTGSLANEAQEEIDVLDSTTTFDDDTRYAANLLRQILRAAGETRFAFGSFNHVRLPKSFKFPKEPESIWEVCKRIVQAANQHSNIHWRLYYDGAGVLRVENMAHGFAFDERTVLDTHEEDFALDQFRNAVVVSVNRGNESAPRRPELVTLPKRNPLSPERLARHGVKRYIVERIDNPHIRTPRKARQLAQAQLHRLSLGTRTVAFDSLPIPILNPGSRCTLTIEGETVHFHAERYTLGFHAEDSMAVGYTRRVRTRARRLLQR